MDTPTALPAAPPTPEQVIAGFTPGMTSAAKMREMLAAVADRLDIVMLVRMSGDRLMTFAPHTGAVTLLSMLGRAMGGLPGESTADWPAFNAVYGDSLGDATRHPDAQMVGHAFTTIGFERVVTDTHQAFNASANVYVVPQDGVYDVSLKFRIADGDITGASYGIGVDVADVDSPAFVWATGAPRRQGAQHRATATFRKGDQLRAFYFFDGTAPSYASAELTILRVR